MVTSWRQEGAGSGAGLSHTEEEVVPEWVRGTQGRQGELLAAL